MDEPPLTLKGLFEQRDTRFNGLLREETSRATEFSKLLSLNSFRKRGLNVQLLEKKTKSIKIAMVGGSSLRPLADLVEHLVSVLSPFEAEVWVGGFDNYTSEIIDEASDLYAFGPDVTVFLPSESRCRYLGSWTEPYDVQADVAASTAQEIIDLCETLHAGSRSQVILCNFKLSPNPDPGPMRSTNLTSDYSFRRHVNSLLGRNVRPFLQVCDVEFLANSIGTQLATDDRAWFESKQPGSKELITLIAREIATLVNSQYNPPKKVAVLDLDNTLWGGVIGDDGIEGIEIGTTSARGEAFRHFQQYLHSLSTRGILLAVCSKNNHDVGMQPFLDHPEMILRPDNIVCFKINWEPKSDNIRAIAQELNLGLDSFIFLDDNPAEIEIVRQFAPEVTGIWLGDDPSTFAMTVQESRVFETKLITAEDLQRVSTYKAEAGRKILQASAANMPAYLASLEMVAQIQDFAPIDVPRISQLINKSNQFNLTTIRRSEAEVHEIIDDPKKVGLTVRLADRYGDHGLIGILVCDIIGELFSIDTWIMSCRVLKRQVEDLMLNQVFQIAKERGCTTVQGKYRPTAKNEMVKNHYRDFGFELTHSSPEESIFQLATGSFTAHHTKIKESHLDGN